MKKSASASVLSASGTCPKKNGKTWASLLLLDYFSKYTKAWYVSAEEGIDLEFKESIKRAKIDVKNRNVQFSEYTPIEDLKIMLKKQRAPKVVFIDNLTVYSDEFTSSEIKKIKKEFPKTLFVFIAHEEKGKPYLSCANTASKLAKVIIRVDGLSLLVGGRVPGGSLNINEEKATLYHGQTA